MDPLDRLITYVTSRLGGLESLACQVGNTLGYAVRHLIRVAPISGGNAISLSAPHPSLRCLAEGNRILQRTCDRVIGVQARGLSPVLRFGAEIPVVATDQPMSRVHSIVCDPPLWVDGLMGALFSATCRAFSFHLAHGNVQHETATRSPTITDLTQFYAVTCSVLVVIGNP